MIQNIRRSLTDLLGAEYTAAVCRARAALTGESPEALRAVADEEGEARKGHTESCQRRDLRADQQARDRRGDLIFPQNHVENGGAQRE